MTWVDLFRIRSKIQSEYFHHGARKGPRRVEERILLEIMPEQTLPGLGVPRNGCRNCSLGTHGLAVQVTAREVRPGYEMVAENDRLPDLPQVIPGF